MVDKVRVLVYGGKGALGSKCVSAFKSKNFWVASVGYTENSEADFNAVLKKDMDYSQQAKLVGDSVKSALNGSKFDGIFCVAGGWAGGNADKDNLIQACEDMWKSSVWSATIAASIAAKHLKEGGILTLTGAKGALNATPDMIGYGIAKAAVHHLTKSLGKEKGGLPKNATAAAILPDILDTPMNRKFMPKADFTNWTPLDFVANLFYEWIEGKNVPAKGSLLQLVTKNSITEVIPA